jgi:hypothetical protein
LFHLDEVTRGQGRYRPAAVEKVGRQVMTETWCREGAHDDVLIRLMMADRGS